jgi:hypothetical protein
MHRIKRIITVTAISAIAAGSVPTIAAAETNTGPRPTICSNNAALSGLIKTLGDIGHAMDSGSAANTIFLGAQRAVFDAAMSNC